MAQFNKTTQQFNNQNKTLYDVLMLANKDGDPIDVTNPLHVSLGSENITITGNVNIADNIRVNNTTAQGIPIKNDNGGPLSVSVSNFPATQTVAGSVNIGTMPEVEIKNDSGNPIPVSGSVSVSNLPATQTVSGTVNIGTMPEVEIKNDSGNPIPVSGSVSVSNLPATQNIAGSVSVSNFPATQTVAGSVSVSNFPATQTVNGTVNIGTIPEVEIKNDTGNPIPVNGTVNIGTMPEVEIKNDVGNPLKVTFADTNGSTTNFDFTSKNRLKISAYETSFFNTFQFGKETDVWDEQTSNGGTATHSPALSGVIMAVTNQTGSEVIRQTRNVMRYIPGRTSTVSFAIRMETPKSGIRRRFGLFDLNNGAYFEDGGDGTYYCVIRSSTSGSPQEIRIPRANWNGDKLDGSGPSGIVADPNAQHLINIEYEWYGAGQIKFSYLINGKTITIHTINNANILPTVWCSTPFLPIRLEITNLTGAAGTSYLYQGSNSIISEGVPEKLGTLQNIITPLTGRTLQTANTFYPILSIRLKSTALQGVVLPIEFQAASTDNTNIFYQLFKNATLTGTSWVDMSDSNSFVQYDASATAISGGIALDAGFITANSTTQVIINPRAAYQLGRSSMGTVSDTFTLAIASGTNNKSAIASMTWIEQR